MGTSNPDITERETCGTDQYHKRNIRLRGDRYRRGRLESEKYTLDFVSSHAIPSIRDGIRTIPVVFHVIYNQDAENVSDKKIYRQLEIINTDFRKLNPDIINIPDPWKPLAADSFIEFKLARKDPMGKATNGITRTRTDIEQFIFTDNQDEKEKIKYTSEGGKDAWDTSRYLNIWICNMKAIFDGVEWSLNGYAQFPESPEGPAWGPPETDGVVIRYDLVGGNPANASRGSGRTAVHEIGHYLNCYHIWGNDVQGQDPCLAADNVRDTPNQAGPNRGKPNFPNQLQVCNDTGSNGTMFMNYMDYSDDDCRYMFTAGQVARMHATLAGARASLLQSDVLTGPEEEAFGTDSMRVQDIVYDGVDKVENIEKIVNITKKV